MKRALPYLVSIVGLVVTTAVLVSIRGRINTTTVALTLLLGVLFVAAVIWKGKSTLANYTSAVGQQEFDQGANRFIKGLFEVLMERLATNSGLQGADPAPATVLAEIEKRRNAVKADFDAGLAILAQRDFPNKSTLMQELQAALGKANDSASAPTPRSSCPATSATKRCARPTFR